MALDFSRLSILLIEDSPFMRSLMVGVMRAMGIERLHIAEDGQDALDMIKVLAGDVEKTGFSPIDMIVTDLEMPRMDGLMLLRWLRRHEQSPDRFIPVVMADVADGKLVAKARDAVVTEFVVKPFSVDGLAARMANVIEFPRQYIYNPTYFGPDRRRHESSEIEGEKRKLTDSDVNIIYSGKTPEANKEGVKIWIFRQQNRLLEKMGGKSATEGGSIGPDMLKAAREQVVEMEEDYADWVGNSISQLEQAHNRIVENNADAPRQLDKIREVSRELRGQGGMFGYPLMTHFGRSLEEVAEASGRATEPLIDLVSAHIEGIKVVMREHIKGDGGQIGAELLKGLEEAKKKHATGKAP